MTVSCLNCGSPYPESGAPYVCPRCGGLFDYAEPFSYEVPESPTPGYWDHVNALGFTLEPVTLGEGQTPLMPVDALDRTLYLKCEFANPTGSFKDRGTASLVSFLHSRGVTSAIEDSSGNAGASFAAYAARAGISAQVFVPESASGPKLKQIAMYGAVVSTVAGPRSNAAAEARRAAEAGAVYASHAYLPFNLPGYATCAMELVEQLGEAPGAVVVPAGQGGLLLGTARGFQSLVRAGRIERMPVMIGVQAAACAPLAALFDMGMLGLSFVTEGATIAEGVRNRSPLRARAVVDTVRDSGGRILSVSEEAILPGRDALALLGFYVEPTSAIVWNALEQVLPTLADPVVAILTGSGYKVRI